MTTYEFVLFYYILTPCALTARCPHMFCFERTILITHIQHTQKGDCGETLPLVVLAKANGCCVTIIENVMHLSVWWSMESIFEYYCRSTHFESNWADSKKRDDVRDWRYKCRRRSIVQSNQKAASRSWSKAADMRLIKVVQGPNEVDCNSERDTDQVFLTWLCTTNTTTRPLMLLLVYIFEYILLWKDNWSCDSLHCLWEAFTRSIHEKHSWEAFMRSISACRFTFYKSVSCFRKLYRGRRYAMDLRCPSQLVYSHMCNGRI